MSDNGQEKQVLFEIKQLCKSFGPTKVLDHIDATIRQGEVVVIVGPSGSGKSTFLRSLNLLEMPTSGEILFEGKEITDPKSNLNQYRQKIGMVFQHFNLFANKTILENMTLAPIKVLKKSKAEAEKEAMELLARVGLAEKANAYPAQLSGGQKQRVAIGSAIIRKPKAFLMDEPLSNLDAKLRAQMRVELVKLHKQLDTTIIYVTHDQTEAMTLGTKIVVMKDGLIQQVGAPQSIYDNPVNLFVAGFLGSPSMNFFRCTVKAEENNRTALLLDDAKTVKKVYLDGTRGKQIADRYNGRHVILGIRPEDIYELDEAKKLGIENESVDVDEPVVNREMLGAEVILYFDEQGKTLAVRLSPENQTQVGEKVSLYFDMEKAHVFDPETEENIFVS